MKRRANTTTSPGDPSDRGVPFASVAVRHGTGVGRGDGAAGDRAAEALPDADALTDADDHRPRTVRVRNAADESRRLTVEVSRGADILVDRTVEFPADGVLELLLCVPGEYRVLAGPADGEQVAVAVDRSAFGADASGPELAVLPDGRVEATPDGAGEIEAVRHESAPADSTSRGTAATDGTAERRDSAAGDADAGTVDRTRRAAEP